MQSTQSGWWRRHGWTVAILLSAFGMAFAVRTIWTLPIIQQFGPLFTYAGGSDSYYHSRVTTFIILNHRNLVFDPLLHYPVGGYNPREPLFDWMNAVLGIVFAPLFGGNAVTAGAWFLDFQAPFWAALGVFPVYLIGREVSGRRTGLIAALIFPFLSANIDSSIFGYANYLSFYTFVILITVYSYIRTVKAVGSRRWVESYRHPRQYLPGLRAFLRTERTAVKWAVFTGVSLGALALAWQGYTYAIVVIGISLLVAMMVERIRRVDSFGLYVCTWIVGLVGFPMAVPYYLVQHQFNAWFDLPLLLFFGVLGLLLPFLLMRDIPWVFSIPALVLFVLAAAAFLAVFEPTYFINIITGQGYFAKTLVYSTVAEAQAPSVDALVVGYGVVTFFLAFAGLAIFVYLLAKGRFRRHHIVFLVFVILSIYLPISAAKFFLLGSPAFALLPAEAIRRALDVGGYPELRRTVVSLSDRRSQAAAFRKAFKPRHVLVILLVLVIVLPNVWVSVDAGIPGNSKSQVSGQVYNSLPSFLKGNSSTAANYFGAAGSSIDTSSQYDSAGYNWLAQQDANTPQPQRPAFVSWWDYGFQAIDQGAHPSVADNFQNGIDPAGQFLLAQNESNAIAVLITTLLQAEQAASGQKYLPSTLNSLLTLEGVNVTELHSLLVNESEDVALVVNNPHLYLPVNPKTLTADNAMYLATSHFLASSSTLSGVASVYNAVQTYTGWSIRYDMADSRLIPFSGQNTGIFYAPADLTGRVINSAGDPSSFFNVTVLGSDGNYYPLGGVPASVSPVNYYVNYFAPFYNSMIYRTYFGYNGTDIGLTGGIPGLEGAAGVDPVEPGWMLQHFEVVYKTAYFCGSNLTYDARPGCYVAVNQPRALSLAAQHHGIANTSSSLYFSGGESMLEYYPGQTLLGDVQLPGGGAVSGVRVTVFDQWGIPHMSVLTGSDGSFSIVLPPGNDTLNITTGAVVGLSQQGSTVLDSLSINVPNAVGLSFASPSVQRTFVLGSGSVFGFVFWNVANTTAYLPGKDPLVAGAQIVLWGTQNTSKLTTTTDASGAFQLTGVPPGTYDRNVLYGGFNFTTPQITVNPSPGAPTNATVGIYPGSVSGTVFTSAGARAAGALVTLGGTAGVLRTNTTNGTGVFRVSGYPPGNYTLTATLPGTSERSAGVRIPFLAPAGNVTENLTLSATSTVSVTVEANGEPATNVPVQFTPIASYLNTTRSPLADLSDASQNGTTALSGGNGLVTLSLPLGNYSVSALGFVGSSLYAGVGQVEVSSLAAPASLLLSLGPAIPLSGSVSSAGPASSSVVTAVIAYAADGSPYFSWATNGSYSFFLPAGAYSLLAIQGPRTQLGTIYAALGSVSLFYATTLNLQPSVAIVARFSVGSLLPNGQLFPAAGARVTIAAGSNGPTVSSLASANGTLVSYLPAALPLPATGYCVAAGSGGFVTASQCGISPNGLASMTRFPIVLTSVPVAVRASGVPSGTTITVNITAASATAVNQTLTGGPTWNLDLPPGSYTISGWAPTGNGSVLYLPAGHRVETIAFGSTSGELTLALLSQTRSSGSIGLPSGGLLANATVTLSSASFNITRNGTAYVSGFFLPTGSYSAYGTLKSGSPTTTYVALGPVSASAGGRIAPIVSLTSPGYNVTGTLTTPSGATLAVNTSLTLTTSAGASALVSVRAGAFTAVLPGGESYRVGVAVTTQSRSGAGPFVESWVASPGSSCVVGTAAVSCAVTMVGTSQLVWLNGTLSAAGVPGLVPGTVRLLGPSSGPEVTVVPATNGTFSTQVLPGSYSLYASGGGGSEPLAGFASVAASLRTANPFSVVLLPTWAETVSVAAPSGPSTLLGPINVTITNAFGISTFYSNVAPVTPFVVALPVGSYTVSAASFGAPYGLAANATATGTVKVVNGNVGTSLSLEFAYTYRASASIVGTGHATVTSPGTASFAFSVQNTGNAPLAVHPVGSPAFWGFNFSFSNVTLPPGGPGSILSAGVQVSVPAATPVAHPGVVIDLEMANGTIVGAISPTITVVSYYGLGVGPIPTSPPEVGVNHALVPFYVSNTGNIGESVLLTVVNAPQLESRGWSSAFRSLSAPLTTPSVFVGAFTNDSYYVNLTTAGSTFLPIGEVTVEGSVTNASGSVQALAVVSVATVSVTTQSTNGTAAVTVTGPSVSTPPSTLPDWVVPLLSFVPAVALVVGVITIRWWRSRRWARR